MFDSATTSVRVSNDRHGPRWSKGTVLIVEDHADSREILSLLFHSAGYTVVEAQDGYEALLLLAHTSLDLIVTDFGLPGMDGLEFVRRVRAHKRNQRDLKIALVTAYDLGTCPEAARNAGCDLVVAKPIDMDRFNLMVSLVAQQAESQSASAEGHACDRNYRQQDGRHADLVS